MRACVLVGRTTKVTLRGRFFRMPVQVVHPYFFETQPDLVRSFFPFLNQHRVLTHLGPALDALAYSRARGFLSCTTYSYSPNEISWLWRPQFEVSNFSPQQLDCLLSNKSFTPPAVNQLPFSISYAEPNILEDGRFVILYIYIYIHSINGKSFSTSYCKTRARHDHDWGVFQKLKGVAW